MSAGQFENSIYQTNDGTLYPIRIQPETASLTLNGVANAAASGPVTGNLPSAQISKGRRSHGVNARLIRFRFTGAVPPGYTPNGVITLPVLSSASYTAYGKTQVGTYTLLGVDYDIAYVGKTPEKIN